MAELSYAVMSDHCINLSSYYTECRAGADNPFQGAITFDNILLAWVAIFQVSNSYLDSLLFMFQRKTSVFGVLDFAFLGLGLFR